MEEIKVPPTNSSASSTPSTQAPSSNPPSEKVGQDKTVVSEPIASTSPVSQDNTKATTPSTSQQPVTDNPAVTTTPSSTAADIQSHSRSSKGKIIGVIVVLLILIGGVTAYFYAGANNTKSPAQTTNEKHGMMQKSPVSSPTPAISISPVTQQNSDQTLNTTQQEIQQSTDQMNNDLNNLNTINTAQDSASNL